MKAVIVGQGLAGTMAAKTLRELDAFVDIEIYAEETHPYYPRPHLIEYLAGNLPYERLFPFPPAWAERQRIAVHAGRPVKRIDRRAAEVETADGTRVAYDALLLAGGARAAVPQLGGSDKRGVFTLRTLDDTLAVLDYLKTHPRVAILGGGLLGLEIARALRTRGAEVEVAEVFDRLLPRQLDPPAAALLKAELEKTGLRVRLGVAAEEVLGGAEAAGLRFKGGVELGADMIVVAAGVRPDLTLASEAGLPVERGLVVDDFLRTSDPKIFAAGDITQHRGRVYGIIPAAFDQARAAAYGMLGLEKPYEGTVPSTTLKVSGLYVTSTGLTSPESGDYEVLTFENPETALYKKIVLERGALVGAIWMGTKKGAAEIARAAARRRNVASWKGDLLRDDFDFSVLDS
jgi:nitrite reductase (NADH) large subunit